MFTHLTLWKASGEDPYILEHCGHRGIRDRFAIIGLISRTVAALSFLSCFYSFAMLFDNIVMAIPISLFFAWMINNIYEVMLGTLSKPVLKNKYEDVIKHLSITLRIGFIIFFAVFISKPLEAWIFQDTLSSRVAKLKADQIHRADRQLEVYYTENLFKIRQAIQRKESFHYPETAIAPLRAVYEQLLRDRQEALDRIEFVVSRADYFIQRIQLLTTGGIFASAWLLTAMMVALFLLPVYLKWKIKSENPYIRRKTTVYREIVESNYADFKRAYSSLFRERYGLDIHYQERHSDPPYNTELIPDTRAYCTQDDFFQHYQ